MSLDAELKEIFQRLTAVEVKVNEIRKYVNHHSEALKNINERLGGLTESVGSNMSKLNLLEKLIISTLIGVGGGILLQIILKILKL